LFEGSKSLSEKGIKYMSEKRVVLITGAASGIGLETAKQFMASGASVLAADINKDLLGENAADLGENYLPLVLDVADENRIEEVSGQVRENYGKLDALVNNAVTAELGEPGELSGERFDHEMSVNLKGPMLLVKHFAPLLRNSENGSVVNICSIAAITELPGHFLYSAAKTALEKFTRDCCRAVTGVRHNCILPGFIETPILDTYGDEAEFVRETARNSSPAGRMGMPIDIAYAIEFLCSNKATFINGATLVVDGGLTKAASSPF
jgi:NAD(P)-dependent dehydrogenase (short-subunit alcohol dehydrogenase family)